MTGDIATAFRDGAAQMEYDLRVQQDIRNALTYPAILVLSGIGAVLFIFVVVVPRFAGMFAGAQDRIPWMARVVMDVGLFVRDNLTLIAGGLAVAVSLIGLGLRNPESRARLLEAMRAVPLVGAWLVEAEAARWAAMLGTLLKNRVPLMQGLELSRHALRLPSIRDRMAQVEKAVRGGASLAAALAEHTTFAGVGINLVRVGEQAGNLPDMLRSFAALYERAGRERMKRFLLLVEPAAILIIGGVIGVIVTSILLAITSISDIPL